MKSSKNLPLTSVLIGLDEHTRYLSLSEVSEELEASGIDVASALSRAHAVIRANVPYKAPRPKIATIGDSLRNAVSEMIRSFEGKSEDEIFAAYGQFTASLPPDKAADFRDGRELSSEEIIRILGEHATEKTDSDGSTDSQKTS